MKKLILSSALCLLCWLGAQAQATLETGRRYYMWKEYARAVPYLQSAAKEGYGEACYMLGEMYYNGNGVEKNYTIAKRMYERSTEFGYNKGEAELGRMYEKGEGVEKNPEKAFELYQKSYAKHDLLGAYLLARSYYYGIGNPGNNTEAYYMFMTLYQSRNFNSDYKWAWNWTCWYIGKCYEFGYGVAENLEEAVRFYAKSDIAESKYHAAKLMKEKHLSISDINLKYLILNAIRLGLDDAEAYYEYARSEIERWKSSINDETFDLLVKAAEKGYGPAQKLLGDCYKNGWKISVNYLKAREWYAKAKANGEEVPEL